MRGLFWCQHLLGIGHLIRGLRLCQELVNICEIDFLQGGREINRTIESPNFHKIALPPITSTTLNNQELLEKRRKFLQECLTKPYDFFISQSFPMGKHDFADEVLGIIKQVKQKNPRARIICSCLDYLNLDPTKTEWIYQIVNEYYDRILVHCDPQLVDDPSPLTKSLKDKIVYTGFVSSGSTLPSSTQRIKRILVTMGGGNVGEELLRAVAQTAVFFPDYQFLLVQGPEPSQKLQKDLQDFFSISGIQNVVLVPFLENFIEELQKSALSISLGGSTLIDLCETKTPGIVYPYPSKYSKQRMRAENFEKKGIVTVLSSTDLHPDKLRVTIQKSLQSKFPDIKVNLDGAKNTRVELQNF